MNSKPFVDSYAGQSTDELIALEQRFRSDSLVPAFEEAITAKWENGKTISDEEAVVLTIEALEREVNNGGFRQFFFNSSRIFASFAPHALSAIDCPKTLEVVREAVRIVGTDDPNRLRELVDYEHPRADANCFQLLDACDARYYGTGEDLASRLFDFIVKNREAIALPFANSGYRAFPPRLPEQPIFYPVCNVEYAREIAQRWNINESGAGYVTAFDVGASFISKYDVHQAGNRTHLEYWIPAEELDKFNRHIIGLICVLERYET